MQHAEKELKKKPQICGRASKRFGDTQHGQQPPQQRIRHKFIKLKTSAGQIDLKASSGIKIHQLNKIDERHIENSPPLVQQQYDKMKRFMNRITGAISKPTIEDIVQRIVEIASIGIKSFSAKSPLIMLRIAVKALMHGIHTSHIPAPSGGTGGLSLGQHDPHQTDNWRQKIHGAMGFSVKVINSIINGSNLTNISAIISPGQRVHSIGGSPIIIVISIHILSMQIGINSAQLHIS